MNVKNLSNVFIMKIVGLMSLCILFFTLSGCVFENKQVARFFQLSAATDGAKVLEDYLPKDDTTLFVALRIEEIFNLDEGLNGLSEMPNNLVMMKNDGDLSLNGDIRKLWQKGNDRLAYAVVKKSDDDETVVARGLDDVYLSLNITNFEKYDELIEKLGNQPGYTITEYKGNKILQNADDKFYATRIGNLHIQSNKLDNLRNLINNPDGFANDSLRNGEGYLSFIKKIDEDYSGWFYINADRIRGESKSSESDFYDYILFGDSDDIFYRAFYTVNKGDKSMYFKGMALNKEGEFVNNSSENLYLDKKMPGEKLIAYFEKSNLAKLIEKGKDKSGYNYFTRSIAAFGFDYEEDIKPLISKNFAFGMYDSGNLLQSFVVMVDIEGAEDQATKFLKKVDEMVDVYVTSLAYNNNGGVKLEESDFITKESVKTLGGTLESVNVKIDKMMPLMAEEDFVYEGQVMIPKEASFYYGIVDNYLIFALYPNFNEVYGSPYLSESYKTSILGGTGVHRLVLDLDNIYERIDSMMLFYAKASGRPDDYMKSTFDDLKKLIPIKSINLIGKDDFGTANIEGIINLR